MKSKRTPLGELRPSQLLYAFGIGAIVDLPHLSVIVTGLEDWPVGSCKPLREDRLLEQVRRRLGMQVETLYAPPTRDEVSTGWMSSFEDQTVVGVPVAPFPRWLRCPYCSLLAPIKSGLFQLRTTPGRPDLAKFVHGNCSKATFGAPPTALPARFLFACEAGHLDDFPWHWFVHKGQKQGPSGCFGVLELREYGVSGEAADVEVACRQCGDKRRMADAFGPEALRNLPPCRGRRPQLRDFQNEPCSADRQAILLGASNAWFGVTVSTLYVPEPQESRLARLVEEHWTTLGDVDDPSILRFLRKQGKLGAFAAHDDDTLWAAIEQHRSTSARAAADSGDIKAPEWRVFSKPDPALNGADFDLRPVEVPAKWRRYIARVVLAERLREVTALTGFTRIASPRDYAEGEDLPSKMRAPISRNPPTFVPAAEVRGEGIFIQFQEQALAEWCDAHADYEEHFVRAHAAWRRRRHIPNPSAGFPGLRYVAIHTFSHALMRELALESGYSAASLRERIYARDDDGESGPMAGVLIYTAAPDSEGTLGGLVRMGRPAELERHIGRALEQSTLCSSDPLCADHLPEKDGITLHGACCHACLFAPETSCERGNRYLDRTVLVETVRRAGVHWFGA